MAQFGRDWKRVAEYVGRGVTNDQCFSRWKRHVNPEVAALKGKGAWTEEEVRRCVLHSFNDIWNSGISVDKF